MKPNKSTVQNFIEQNRNPDEQYVDMKSPIVKGTVNVTPMATDHSMRLDFAPGAESAFGV